jgi:hypothetical protein
VIGIAVCLCIGRRFPTYSARKGRLQRTLGLTIKVDRRWSDFYFLLFSKVHPQRSEVRT